ncbi:MAG TPA: 50S ribosomal protein L21 [Chloroflexota bacterium]|nr:50S ribosomal protein L21 [Chloroflexota bacterium]
MYAVLQTGGKQYKVEVGQVLTVEKLDVPAGEDVRFDQVLLISDDGNVTVGTPLVAGAAVTGRVVRQDRGPKIIVFKYKPKVRYRRKTGHRQYQTQVLVETIEDASGTRARRAVRTSAEAPQVSAPAPEPAVVASPQLEPANVASPVVETTEGLAESTQE